MPLQLFRTAILRWFLSESDGFPEEINLGSLEAEEATLFSVAGAVADSAIVLVRCGFTDAKSKKND